MRLVIEATDDERDAISKLVTKLGAPSYSALFRALLKLAVDGTVPHTKIIAEFDSRPVLKVQWEGEAAAKAQAKADYSPPTKREMAEMGDYLRKHPEIKKLNITEWRERRKS